MALQIPVRPIPTSDIGPSTKRSDALSEMQVSLQRYARAQDRRMMLRTLHDYRYLTCTTLNPMEHNGLDSKEIELEVSKETVILNGVTFRAMPAVIDHGVTVSELQMTVKELCGRFAEMDSGVVDSDQLYKSLMRHMSRSTCSADSYFKLHSMMDSADLMVMPTVMLEEQQQPITMRMYVASGSVHATISMMNAFGLFRKADLIPADISKGTLGGGRPWITIQTIVNERVNLTNDESVRTLKIIPPSSIY